VLGTDAAPQGAIDRRLPYTYEFMYRADGGAVYRLRQGATRVDFSSENEGAEAVVRDVLRLEWPPVDKSKFDRF
jgi:hypothetical protein